MTIKRLCALSFLAIGLLAAANLVAGDKDGEISTKVQLKLAEDLVVKGGGLAIDVKDGVVTLSGKVENPNQKSRAEKLTKKVSGVKSVVNNIVVSSHVP